ATESRRTPRGTGAAVPRPATCPHASLVAQPWLFRDEVPGVDGPAHLDRVSDLEELGTTALRIREQRLDARPGGSLDAVDGDVAHVEQLRDGASVAVVRRACWRSRRDAYFLGAKRDRSRPPDAYGRVDRDAHWT